MREAVHFSVRILPNLSRLKVTLKRERPRNKRQRLKQRSEDLENFCFWVPKTEKSKAGTINSRALWTSPIAKLKKRKLKRLNRLLKKKIQKLLPTNQQLRTTLLTTSDCMWWICLTQWRRRNFKSCLESMARSQTLKFHSEREAVARPLVLALLDFRKQKAQSRRSPNWISPTIKGARSTSNQLKRSLRRKRLIPLFSEANASATMKS